jgi:NADH pyrophosphatase NudC (nudix superfamily)
VAFSLFEYESGSLDDHDHEVEDARWMPLVEAAAALTYEGEREMARRALSRVEATK